MKNLTVLFLEEGESWNAFVRRIRKEQGEVLLVLSGLADALLIRHDEERKTFLSTISKMSGRVRIATRNKVIISASRSKGIRVIDHSKDLRSLLHEHSQLNESLRVFMPNIWRQQLRSRLQSMGLLALPKWRIWVLIGVSVFLFYFVLFKLLPSATVTISPRHEVIRHTANIFLVASGSTVEIPDRVRIVELKPVEVTLHKTLTFDQISKKFIGQNSSVPMTIINQSGERYGFLDGSRLINQAGMVFRLQESFYIDPGEELTIMAVAEDEDQYAEVIGERGNVPAGVKWKFAGLSSEEQRKVYAENRVAGTGGVTNYETVLRQKDIDAAEALLKEDLLARTSQMVDDEILLYNERHPDKVLTRLYYDELTRFAFSGFLLPTNFIGENVASVPIEGAVTFKAYSYDAQRILTLLKDELALHVEEGKRLLQDTVTLEQLVTHVIDYEDDLEWIKLTVDLSGIEEAILDPLTPTGAQFGKSLRDSILGKTTEEATRVVKNFPEVEKANISMWPPWSKALPNIPYHISIRLE